MLYATKAIPKSVDFRKLVSGSVKCESISISARASLAIADTEVFGDHLKALPSSGYPPQ